MVHHVAMTMAAAPQQVPLLSKQPAFCGSQFGTNYVWLAQSQLQCLGIPQGGCTSFDGTRSRTPVYSGLASAPKTRAPRVYACIAYKNDRTLLDSDIQTAPTFFPHSCPKVLIGRCASVPHCCFVSDALHLSLRLWQRVRHSCHQQPNVDGCEHQQRRPRRVRHVRGVPNCVRGVHELPRCLCARHRRTGSIRHLPPASCHQRAQL